MPQHDLTGLDPGALLDEAREHRSDGALIETDVPEGIVVERGQRLESFDLDGLRHDDEDVRIAARATAFHRAHDVLARHRDLGNQDEIRAASETTERGDPSGIATHGLDDDDPVMRAGGRAQPIEGVRDDGDRGVEADAELGLGEVVVDGLGDADDANPLLVEPLRDAERVVPADRDERVEARPADAREDGPARGLVLPRIGP